MRCLYCGKELALFKRLRGGEFCSDAHRQRYQEEYTQLALNRLLHANSASEKESDPPDPKEIKPAQPESPALKRRERLGREEAPAAIPARAAPAPAPAAFAKLVESALPKQTAVLDPEPAAVPVASAPQVVAPRAAKELAPQQPAPEQIAVDETAPEEPAPAPMSNFLVECPVAAVFEATIGADPSQLALVPRVAFPRLQTFPREIPDGRLDPAGRIPLAVTTLTDFQTPLRERGLELREFVRGVPQVEIRVRPASETGFAPPQEAFDVDLTAYPPEVPARLWMASEADLPALSLDAEILLGDLARLDFAATGWDNSVLEEAAAEDAPDVAPDSEPPAKNAGLPPAGTIPLGPRLEPMRVDPISLDPSLREGSRTPEEPAPLHFEPVHIDPVFMEQIAGTAEFNAQKKAAAENLPPEPAVVPAIQAPTAPPPPPPPATVTKPAPVTLHGLAPARGKPVQVFTAAVSRVGDIQVPRDTGLPLRPTMVLGPAPKPAPAPAPTPAAAPSIEAKPASATPVKSIPVPEKRDPRPTEVKPRRPEVRILPVQVKQEAPQRQKEPAKPEPIRQSEAPKPEPTKTEAPKPEPAKTILAKEPPAGAIAGPKATPAEKPKAAVPPVEIRPAAAVPAAAARTAPPAEELDGLGLPKLSYNHSENFWTRLPLLVRVGAIAAVLALIIGGVMLTSRGSGAPKVQTPSQSEPQLVEAGAALASSAGWMQDWFTDRGGSGKGRHVDVLRGSLTLRDYRLVFEGQIEQGALGWVFRANEKSFYVEKIQVITPGLQPVVALVHFAVINGQEQPRTQVPLPMQVHLDTTYKVRMDAVGNQFTTYVQDQKVDQWTDTRIDAGGVGLYYDNGDSAKLRDTLNVILLKQK